MTAEEGSEALGRRDGNVRSIWKFELPDTCTFWLELPRGAQILDVQLQHRPAAAPADRSVPVIWALVDPSAEAEPRQFAVVGTGWPLRPDVVFKHLGTLQRPGGEPFHVLELPLEPSDEELADGA
jgi:hypothetical protein